MVLITVLTIFFVISLYNILKIIQIYYFDKHFAKRIDAYWDSVESRIEKGEIIDWDNEPRFAVHQSFDKFSSSMPWDYNFDRMIIYV